MPPDSSMLSERYRLWIWNGRGVKKEVQRAHDNVLLEEILFDSVAK